MRFKSASMDAREGQSERPFCSANAARQPWQNSQVHSPSGLTSASLPGSTPTGAFDHPTARFGLHPVKMSPSGPITSLDSLVQEPIVSRLLRLAGSWTRSFLTATAGPEGAFGRPRANRIQRSAFGATQTVGRFVGFYRRVGVQLTSYGGQRPQTSWSCPGQPESRSSSAAAERRKRKRNRNEKETRKAVRRCGKAVPDDG